MPSPYNIPVTNRVEDTAPKPLFSHTFQAFRHRDFRLMWFGAFTSTTGTWMQLIAQSWLILTLTGSAFYLGLTEFLGQLPILLFSLVAGVLADRVERRKLLLASQYIQMTCAFILTMLLLSGWIAIWHFLLLVVVTGTAQSFGGPAYQALIPGLVRGKEVPNAVALNSIQFNLARVFGPLLAGAALASVGAAFCFAINGFSFIAVIISLYLIQATFKPEKTSKSVLKGIREGLTFVKNQEALWQLSVLGFISTFCGYPLTTLLPVFARDIFDIGVTGYSTMMACSGAGAISGALFYASLSRMRNHGRFSLYAQLIFAFLLTAFALSRYLLLSYAMLYLSGFCLMALYASITGLVQLNTTEVMRGRVVSIFMLAFRGGMPLGSLLGGYLASRFSPSLALMMGSAVLGSVALGFLISRSGVKRL